MWGSEEMLSVLRYREVGATNPNVILAKLKQTSDVEIKDILKFLKQSQGNFMKYNAIILQRIQPLYPKLVKFMSKLINFIVEIIEEVIAVWRDIDNSDNSDNAQYLKGYDSFVNMYYRIFPDDTVNRSMYAKPAIIYFSICIIIIDHLITNEEMYERGTFERGIRDGKIRALKKVKKNLETMQTHEQSDDRDEAIKDEKMLILNEQYSNDFSKLTREYDSSVNTALEELGKFMENMKVSGDTMRQINELSSFGADKFNGKKWKEFNSKYEFDSMNDLLNGMNDYNNTSGEYIEELKSWYEGQRKHITDWLQKDHKQKVSDELSAATEKLSELNKATLQIEMKEYRTMFQELSLFMVSGKKLIVKLGKHDINDAANEFNERVEKIVKAIHKFNDDAGFCFSDRLDTKNEVKQCKRRLEDMLGIDNIDPEIILYPSCELEKCSIENDRGKCFDGAAYKLVKCKKDRFESETSKQWLLSEKTPDDVTF